MARELSKFNQYKRELSKSFAAGSSPANFDWDTVLGTKNYSQKIRDRKFYKFSFKLRLTAELDYKLLGAVKKQSYLTDEQSARVRYYLQQTKFALYRDAVLAGNTHQAKQYDDTAPQPKLDPPGSWQYTKLRKDWDDLLLTGKEINKIIGWLSFLNIYRLIGTFARLSWTTLWALAEQSHLLDDHNALFGYPIDRDILTESTTVFNLLSVLLFIARLLSHIAIILKHFVWRTDAEKGISPWELALRELYLLMPYIVNDTVWCLINLLTNYPQLWGISVATANMITVYTILFDLIWLCVQWAVKEWELYEKFQELTALGLVLEGADAQINQLMLLKLDDEVLETRARFIIQVLACLLIIGSFVSVLTFTASAVVAPIGFFACVVGFSTYLSCDEFAAYWRSFYAHGRRNSTDLTVQKEQQKARTLFLKTISKAALVPTLLVGLYTISWPLALVLTVLYAAYERYGPEPVPIDAEADDADDYVGCSFSH